MSVRSDYTGASLVPLITLVNLSFSESKPPFVLWMMTNLQTVDRKIWTLQMATSKIWGEDESVVHGLGVYNMYMIAVRLNVMDLQVDCK